MWTHVLDKIRVFKLTTERSEFKKNSLVLIAGTIASQCIPIVASPILARLYSPEMFGVYGGLIAWVALISIMATGQYDKGILLPKSHRDAIQLLILACGMVLLASILWAILLFCVSQFCSESVINNIMRYYIFLAPVLLLFTVAQRVCLIWLNRIKAYHVLAKLRIVQAFITACIAITFGLWLQDTIGLILALLIGYLSTILLFCIADKEFNIQDVICASKYLSETASGYKKFPLYMVPSGLIDALILYLPLIVLMIEFDAETAGLYLLTQRVLRAPIYAIVTAVSEVFRQRVAELRQGSHDCRNILMQMSKTMAGLGLIPLLPIALFGEAIFRVCFGSPWAEAGFYAQLLSVVYYLQFIANPAYHVIVITGHQKQELWLKLIGLTLMLIAIIIGIWSQQSRILVTCIALASSVQLASIWLLAFWCSKGESYALSH